MLDSEIIALYWARNEDAIGETSRKYGAYCRTIARNILGSPQDAQECLNDAWLAAWSSIPPHRPAILSAYLGKITRRIALKKRRSALALKRGGGETALALDELRECIPDKGDVETALEMQQLNRIIDSFLGSLAETDRRVFIRRYWAMASIEEIALHFGFSQSKVKSMLHRARLKLMNRLKEEGIQP